MIETYMLAFFSSTFIRYSLLVGVFSSISFGIIGSIVVVKRIGYIAGSISHASLAGIGLSLYLQNVHNIMWFTPLIGILLSSIISAIIISMVSVYSKQRQDSIIGTIWAIGMAIGFILIKITPGYFDAMSYLFGDIQLTTQFDFILILIINIILIFLSILFYNQILIISFDKELAKLKGINVPLYETLLIIMIALTVVLMVSIVGIVMVIALITIPAATAGVFSRKLWKMMVWATLFCMISNVVGQIIGFNINISVGPISIMIAGILYILVLLSSKLFSKGFYKLK